MSNSERNSERRLRPRAFRLDGDETVASKPAPEVIEPEVDVFAEAVELVEGAPGGEEAVAAARAKGVLDRWFLTPGGLFLSALSGLLTLAVSAWAWNLVEDLFRHSAFLGTIGLALAIAAAAAALVFIAREIRSIMLQNRVAKLHAALAGARAANDAEIARVHVLELCALYEQRVDLARPRALMNDYAKQIIDGKDLVDLAERNLVAPLDGQARREIAAAAKRVSVVTAVSPRAVLDVIFVGGQAIVLMRRIAEIYGGRPGLLGFFKLARSVGAHLAITGTVAVGDTLLQQVLGHGIAARLSAKLGEGVLNGLLTARVGLSAMAVCRPTPFVTEKQPGVKDVAPFLFGDKTKA
ncbi:TIGR01620 family protein [Methylocystis sp. IM3]|jgi:putative membrane protein|uniref:YcjF family protein n=1 Tax=unclassified Methylocystis TaxID=2625913 RepID=UPI000F92F5ED|nr:MAG: TIGR01620 family protein [Hyphomicrobiales bacterium]